MERLPVDPPWTPSTQAVEGSVTPGGIVINGAVSKMSTSW